MKKLIALFTLLLMHFVASAQTETFKKMTFELPSDWERTDLSEEMVMLNTKGESSDDYCVVMLTATNVSHTSVSNFFNAKWAELIKVYSGVGELSAEDPTIIDGWDTKLGGAIFQTEYKSGVYMVFCALKNNRGISFQFSSGASTVAIDKLRAFYDSIHFIP